MFEPFAETTSVCPECLEVISARYVAHDEGVYFDKECPEHGSFSTIVWRGSVDSYGSWLADAGLRPDAGPSGPHSVPDRGCPRDCGLCPNHLAETCSAALMVTDRCNMDCRFCFTRSAPCDARPDPTLDELRESLRFYLETSGGPFPLELCGGEPTVREDLPDIARMAHDMGFGHIQLNTNGLLLAQDPGLARRLKDAGVTAAYLGFDGVGDEPYAHIGGDGLMAAKERAVRNCGEAGLAVVLVPTLVPGVNDGAIGAVISKAIEWMPAAKGVNFQPAGYLGEYHAAPYIPTAGNPGEAKRLTIPDVVKQVPSETGTWYLFHVPKTGNTAYPIPVISPIGRRSYNYCQSSRNSRFGCCSGRGI